MRPGPPWKRASYMSRIKVQQLGTKHRPRRLAVSRSHPGSKSGQALRGNSGGEKSTPQAAAFDQAANGAAEDERGFAFAQFVGCAGVPGDRRDEVFIGPAQFEDRPIGAEDELVVQLAREQMPEAALRTLAVDG